VKITFKKLIKPKSNATHEVDAVRLWYVTWTSRYGKYSIHTTKEIEAFASKQDALDFANSIKCAFSLIRHTSETSVSVYSK
jgi:hypothetical protein